MRKKPQISVCHKCEHYMCDMEDIDSKVVLNRCDLVNDIPIGHFPYTRKYNFIRKHIYDIENGVRGPDFLDFWGWETLQKETTAKTDLKTFVPNKSFKIPPKCPYVLEHLLK